jgi:hypothetical protein
MNMLIFVYGMDQEIVVNIHNGVLLSHKAYGLKVNGYNWRTSC